VSDQETAAPKRVLITGASGSIGTATTAYLARMGIAVTALSLAPPFPPEADRVVVGDATSTSDVASAFDDIDAVVHLAAIPHPTLGTPYEVFRTNVNATFNVLAEAGARGVRRAVIASSINAFGVPMNRHGVMPAYFPIDEDLPVDLEDAYSFSKLTDEMTSRMAWRRWGIDTVAFRFPLVKDASVLRKTAAAYVEDPMRCVREGWSYLDTRDAARAIYLALTMPVSGSQVIGLSASDTLFDRPTAELLAEFAPNVPIRRPILGFESAIDTTRASTLLGFQPRYSIHDRSAATRGPAETEDTLNA
jgi:nucleoside-diphosphate-sugar epimerase